MQSSYFSSRDENGSPGDRNHQECRLITLPCYSCHGYSPTNPNLSNHNDQILPQMIWLQLSLRLETATMSSMANGYSYDATVTPHPRPHHAIPDSGILAATAMIQQQQPQSRTAQGHHSYSGSRHSCCHSYSCYCLPSLQLFLLLR